jgi:hypothetical protein
MNARVIALLSVVVGTLPITASGEPLPRFPPGAVWNQNIEAATTHPNSASMIGTLQGLNTGTCSGFGFGCGRLQIDFSIRVVRTGAGAPTATIVSIPNGGNEDRYYLPDCEPLGSSVPVPVGATIEGETGMTCDVFGNDCHYLVVDGNTLHEVYRANLEGGTLHAQCLATWRLDVVYPDVGRGEHCTSADAAGFPIAPLLFNADEVAASLAQDATGGGDIGHAIRFILPNSRMASDVNLPGAVGGRLYVRPATHAGAPSGPTGSVPYGSRLRLRSDFPLTNYTPAARVLLNTMKRYGMVLADGGNIALTAESDVYTTAKWANLNIGSRVFDQTAGATIVRASDFEVIDTGPRIAETYECVRSTIPTEAVLFSNGFE